jgi:YVTN family beta-propeller protein
LSLQPLADYNREVRSKEPIKHMKTLRNVFITSIFAFLLTILLPSLLICQAPKTNSYRLLDKIAVGGEGGWDYVYADSDAHRLYVSHATKVVVIDTDSNKVVGEIADLKGVHGIAVAGDLGRGFISDGRSNAVTIFDTKTLKTIGQVKTGTNPDSIIYDPSSKRVFTFNGGSSDTTAIDPATGTVAGTMPLGGKPEFAVTDEKGTIFVNIEDKSEIVAFDPSKLQVRSRWPLGEGEEPSGLAFDRKHGRLFSVCGNKKMVIVDSGSGKIVATVPIGSGVDAAGFDEKEKLAFASNGEGTLTVVREDSPDKFSVVDTVTTQRGARTMTVDHRNHRIYLPTAQFGETPAPTKERPRPRPPIIPNSFEILVFGK